MIANMRYLARTLGALVLIAAIATGSLGAFWIYAAATGDEWDLCERGSECTSGETIGLLLLVPAAMGVLLGLSLLRRPR